MEAINFSSQAIAGRIEEMMAAVDDRIEAVHAFLITLAGHIEASDFRQGGPITAAALEAASSSDRLRLASNEAYSQWQVAFEEKLRPRYGQGRAGRLAVLIIAVIEGATILCRGQRSIKPYLDAAEEICVLLSCPTAKEEII